MDQGLGWWPGSGEKPGVMQFFDQPHAPRHRHQTGQLEASPTLRGKDPIRWIVLFPGHPRTNALPPARRAQPGRAARRQERQLQDGRLDR
jgi:hypothetical protein